MRTDISDRAPTISVVICAYTEDRWRDLLAAVKSIHDQTRPALELLVVIDHNPRLQARASRALAEARVLFNVGKRGLSGARNTAIAVACGDVIAFMDEDAQAAPDWLERLAAHFAEPAVIGVGGAILPQWPGERPGWFPHEFDWVVGCTYRGMAEQTSVVRNLTGCNLAFRRSLLVALDGFPEGVGCIGTLPLGCEETELRYDPAAAVRHRVTASRATWNYFLRRCWSEGLSKAQIITQVGQGAALSSEREYVWRTLPRGIARALAAAAKGEPSGLARAAAIAVGLATISVGFAWGKVRATSRHAEPAPGTAARRV